MISPANTTRRNVMLSAWRRWREAKADGKPVSIGKCMKKAWAGEKRAIKAADAFMANAAARGGRVSFSSPIYSPTSRTMAGARYAGFQDRQAGRSISRVAR